MGHVIWPFQGRDHYKSSKLTHILTQIYNVNVDNDILANILRAGYIFLAFSFKPVFP